ncbi:hypothetical protein ACFW9L_19070 [Streptomyces sp. NPDC059517]|uniref:hypothetical protein n=1 Tax=Streptomyces sp. NPDC059517 TaxID=3346855 RepID=UPI0036B5D176
MWWEQEVLADTDRLQWTWTPLEGVGPLRFGASHEDVITALGTARVSTDEDQEHRWAHFYGPGVRTYYDRHEDRGLMAIVIDSLRGPQVHYDGTAFTGRAPSELNLWIEQISEVRECRTSIHGEPYFPSLGLVLRSTSNGDHNLSRPVFTDRAWTQCAHPEELLPPPWA